MTTDVATPTTEESPMTAETTTVPTDTDTDPIDEIRGRLAAATPGPWGWFGNTDSRDVYLATRRFGRMTVMRFCRWGMSGAQPVFWVGGELNERDRIFGGRAVRAADLARYEVCPDATSPDDPRVYRRDISGFRAPDAELIAHAPADIAILLAEIDRLRALAATVTR